MMRKIFLSILSLSLLQEAGATIVLEKTRIVIDEGDKSVSLKMSNQNTQLPYLAKAWVENDQGKTDGLPLFAVPPLQRLEARQTGQVSIKVLQEAKDLPQDRESVFYFNLRGIPPNNNKANILQLALQNKLKVFYRPAQLKMSSQEILHNPWQEKLKIIKNGNQVIAKNPTPYFVKLLGVQQKKKGKVFDGFQSIMIAPYEEKPIDLDANWMGQHPIFTYIDDYGRKRSIEFKCASIECAVVGQSFMAESVE